LHHFNFTGKKLAGKLFFTAADFAKAVPAFEMRFKKQADFWTKLMRATAGF
jgi:hypothetical protein